MAQILQEGKFKEWQEKVTCGNCKAVFLAGEIDLVKQVKKSGWLGIRYTTIEFHLVECPNCHVETGITSSAIPKSVLKKFNDRMKKQQAQEVETR